MKKTLLAIVAICVGIVCASCNHPKSESAKSNDKEAVSTNEETPQSEEQKSEKTNKNEDAESAQTTLVTPDLTFFEIHGHVKKVTETDSYGYKTIYEFDQNGKLTKVNGKAASQKYTRDKQGRIVEETGNETFITYEWEDECPIRSENHIGSPVVYSFIYDELGLVVKIKYTEDEDVAYETLSYPALDKYGNWTKRTSKGYEYGRGDATRTIEYYK